MWHLDGAMHLALASDSSKRLAVGRSMERKYANTNNLSRKTVCMARLFNPEAFVIDEGKGKIEGIYSTRQEQ